MKKYFRHKLKNLIMINKIITIHYFEFDKNFKTYGEKHDFWEIVYADKEDILCTRDGKEILLRQGEMLFHKPNEFHTLSANMYRAPNVFIFSFECKSEAMRYYENKKIKLDKSYLKYIYAIIEEGKKTFNIPYSDPDMKKLQLLEFPTLGGQQLIKNYLEILLISIMRSLTESENGNKIFLQKNEYESKLVNDVLTILNDNLYSSLSIEDICKKISYSKAYLFKEFKTATGKGITECFIAMKIEKAKHFLRENQLSVKQISEKLSFYTPNYFSKTFKHLTSLTPTAYKKRTMKP